MNTNTWPTGIHASAARNSRKDLMPKINLTWNQIINGVTMTIQMLMVGNVIDSPAAIRWMLLAANIIKAWQLYIAGVSNPDGSKIEAAALVTKTETKTETAIELRKEAPPDVKP